MANKVRDTQKFFSAPIIPNAPPEYNPASEASKNTILRFYFQGVDEALRQALQFDSDDIIDGSIPNSKLENSTVSFGGVTLSLGGSDATPAFNLSDATGYPTSSLVGTITNAQLAGSIENAKLSNSTVSYGGVQLSLGGTDATPAFNLSDATNYPTSSLSGTITNAQLAGSIENSKLVNDSVSYGGVSLDLGQSDATPAFDLSDATNYPTSSLSGTIATAQIADLAVTGAKIADATITFQKMGTASVNSAALQPLAVTTSKIADDAVTSAKITGPFSSKQSIFSNTSTNINTTSPVTIRQFSIPAPPAGNAATQSLTLTLKMRIGNTSSSSSKLNHQFRILMQMVSKAATGVSVGTWQFVTVPSTYNAWYKVSGNITDKLASGMGKLGTTAAGANAATIVEYYYYAGFTYVRISKFPDPATVFNGVEVFYSKSGFTTPGTYVAVPDFYSQYISLPPSSYEIRMIPLTFSFGSETTDSTIRIQFDHVSSITNINTILFGYYGFTENTV
jgi:hypothetical protein